MYIIKQSSKEVWNRIPSYEVLRPMKKFTHEKDQQFSQGIVQSRNGQSRNSSVKEKFSQGMVQSKNCSAKE